MSIDVNRLPQIPIWARSGPLTLEDAPFRSGAALAVLHDLLAHPSIPHPLLRQRLALRAAERCVAFANRPECARALRDEIHLLRPGDQPGPAGIVFRHWSRGVARPVSMRNLTPVLPANLDAYWNVRVQGGPVERAAHVLQAVLADHPRQEDAALMLADATLARTLKWTHMVPLISVGVASRDLRKTGEELRLACYVAVTRAALDVVALAGELDRRAARLRAVLPKLRSKGAEAAADVFLSVDAISPGIGLSGILSDRSARRLCDRLVDLGGVQELTGRSTSRLYGL